MAGLEQTGADSHLAAQALLLVRPVARAAGGVEGQPRAPQRREALAGEVDIALIQRHDLGQQLVLAAEHGRQVHADEGVVTHEAGELQLLRVIGDQLQQLPERLGVAHATAVQAHIQFDIDP